MKTETKNQYVAFIRRTDSVKRFPLFSQTQADTLEKSKKRFNDYRKTWEKTHATFDFDDVVFQHRTVITVVSEWEEALV